MRLNHILQGIAVSLSGASIWLIFYLLRLYEGSDRMMVVGFCTVFGLAMSSVYVVPLGAVLGMIVPPFCAGNSLTVTVLGAVLIATVVTGVTSLLVTAVFDLALVSVFRSMWAVAVPLIVGWTIFVRRAALRAISH